MILWRWHVCVCVLLLLLAISVLHTQTMCGASSCCRCAAPTSNLPIESICMCVCVCTCIKHAVTSITKSISCTLTRRLAARIDNNDDSKPRTSMSRQSYVQTDGRTNVWYGGTCGCNIACQHFALILSDCCCWRKLRQLLVGGGWEIGVGSCVRTFVSY